MLSRRPTGLRGRSSCRTGRPLLALFLAALLVVLSPASAFLSSSPPRPSSSASSSSRSAKRAERLAPLHGIKRKVKVEMEENFSGKVVEPAGAATSMFGSDANALFDVIEKNKKKAAEAAAAAAAAAADGNGDDDGDEEGADGGDAGVGDGETA
ncbi:expressed unknown protein [Ectocarpus siliculosus]|uniref:Uncharacterized protein n=1 Tax=Ectocarpus siliculosus TaxID=2880 RepID=D8LMW5_ECTSI|nr:expressed unknown protein [Ectocarpus siliculosus]|eukprot:CBN74766.1 expressed unknown protein [Ectocarpus siliculosus]